MSSISEHCGTPPEYSNIIYSYFEDIECASTDLSRGGLVGDRQANRNSNSSNSSNSSYNTDSSATATAKPLRRTKCSFGLCLAFRVLCQVGLYIATLRHDRAKKETPLRRLEERVDNCAKDLLLQQGLTASGDTVEGTNFYMSKIASAVMVGGPSGTQDTKHFLGHEQSRTDAELRHLQAVAGEVVQLRSDLEDMTTRLHVEERVLLLTFLERWREAVVQYKKHCQRADMSSCEVTNASGAASSSLTEGNELVSVLEEASRFLARFDLGGSNCNNSSI